MTAIRPIATSARLGSTVLFGLFAALSCSGDVVGPIPVVPPPADFQLLVERRGPMGTPTYQVMDLDGTHVAPFGAVPENSDNLTPSPDGSRIAFRRLDFASGLIHLWVMDRDGRNARLVLGGNQFVAEPTWSPDGARIAFTSKSFDDVWVVNADGSGAVNLTPDPLPAVIPEREPAWSPDGRRIAFFSGRSGFPRIWLMRPDGSDLVQMVSQDTAAQADPVWSPDGTRLAWLSGSPGRFGISVSGLDGSGYMRFPQGGTAARITAWMPDGRIAFASNQELNFEIYALDPETGTTSNLTREPSDEVWAAVLKRPVGATAAGSVTPGLVALTGAIPGRSNPLTRTR